MVAAGDILNVSANQKVVKEVVYMLLFGADRIGEYRDLFAGRVALLTSPTGRTGSNRSTIEVLMEFCDLQLLLAPEHGVRGD